MRVVILFVLFPIVLYSNWEKPKPGYENLSMCDGQKFTKTWTHDTLVQRLYKELSRENDYMVYSHGFRIERGGSIIPYKFYGHPLLKNLIVTFNNIKWNCGKFRDSFDGHKNLYGMMTIYLVPQKKIIQLIVDVGDGRLSPQSRTSILYNHSLRML